MLINQSAGYLFVDIANAFAKHGYNVSFMSGHRSDDLLENICYEHIVAYNKRNYIMRMSTWLVAYMQILCKVRLKYAGVPLLIVSNPPMATLLPRWIHNKRSFLIYDIYPDVLWHNGILPSNHFMMNWWKKKNKDNYAKADTVFTISESMGESLTQYVNKSKINIVPLWSNANNLKYVDRISNKFMEEYDLQSKFVILYSGNMGKNHPVEFLVELAEKMLSHKDVCFLIVGSGFKRDVIEKRIQTKQLTNVLLLPLQPIERLSEMLSCAHLGVVAQDEKVVTLSLPSKTFNLLHIGVPLLCIADKKSELHRLVTSNRVGMCFLPNDLNLMEKYVLEMKADENLWSVLHCNALRLSQKFSSENASRFVNGVE